MYINSEKNIGFNLNQYDFIQVKYNLKHKIVNLQTVQFLKYKKYELHNIDYLSDIIETVINFQDLKKIINLIIDRFEGFDFWWYDYHEIRIDYNLHKGFHLLNSLFEQNKNVKSLCFVDNNLYENSSYNTEFNYMGIPSMIGQTCIFNHMSLNKTFKKKFICLNRLPKYHREVIFDFLDTNYKKDSYISYAPYQEWNPKHRILDDLHFTETDRRNYASSYQKNSFCNIITESTTEDGIIHITEKTDKAITSCQPFIIVAGPHYLKKLKELGFKTFDKWWDESYDSELNLDIRLNNIKEVIKEIASWDYDKCNSVYHEMAETILHNKQILINYAKNNKYHMEYWQTGKLKLT